MCTFLFREDDKPKTNDAQTVRSLNSQWLNIIKCFGNDTETFTDWQIVVIKSFELVSSLMTGWTLLIGGAASPPIQKISSNTD